MVSDLIILINLKSSRSKSLADTNHTIGVKNEGFSELVDGPRMWEKKL